MYTYGISDLHYMYYTCVIPLAQDRLWTKCLDCNSSNLC